MQVVVRHITHLRAALPGKVSAGELTHMKAGDIGTAQTLTSTGPGVGAVIAYVSAAVLLFVAALLAPVTSFIEGADDLPCGLVPRAG
ncbi:hypothetical protein ABZ383_00055 [Streptomyces sp. NPDC005900]|uniref:hypothetical protein n=1 Tax=Streptomyces sp. NPDC005900 TaxID=3154569 RepID=UPI0033D33B14